jgi:hypothetical protein
MSAGDQDALEQVTGIDALLNAQKSFKVRSICIHYLIVISFRYEVNVDTAQCVWFELSMQSAGESPGYDLRPR